MPQSKIVLITGANRGIGLSFAKAYHAKGWRIIATARKPADAQSKLDFIPKDDIYSLDTTSEDSIAKLKSSLKSIKLDLLINNAGIYLRDNGHFEQLSAESIMQQFQVNSLGPLLVTKALLENLNQGPETLTKVVNITSLMGSIADNTSGGSFGYRASKAALNCFTKTMAINFKNEGKNIAVMALHPGYIQTDMTHGRGDMDSDEAVKRMIVQIEKLSKDGSGSFVHRDGQVLPY